MKEIKHITLEDGRKGEKVTYEHGDETTVEIYVEPVRPLVLQERVTEKRKPVVYERTIEKADLEGNVIEQKVESLEAKNTMQIVDHIGVQKNESVAMASQNISREEAMELVISSIKAMKSESEVNYNVQSAPVAPKVKGFEAQGIIEDFEKKVGAKVNSVGNNNLIYLAIIAAQVGGLIWYLMR
jgi:hypothetical protein